MEVSPGTGPDHVRVRVVEPGVLKPQLVNQ